MDPYAHSVERVDLALERLNATLTSYRIAQAARTRAEDTPAKQQPSVECSNVKQVLPDDERSASESREQAPESNHLIWDAVMQLSEHSIVEQSTKDEMPGTIAMVEELFEVLSDDCYSLPLYLLLSQKYLQLGYPDLASGAAYKALLLSDAVLDESDEYHHEACEALRTVVAQQPLGRRIKMLKTELDAGMDSDGGEHVHGEGAEEELPEECDIETDVWLREHYLPIIYPALVYSLLLCGCYKSAYEYCTRGQDLYPDSILLKQCREKIVTAVASRKGQTPENILHGEESGPNTWPDSGFVRRERYPWNNFEPNRNDDLHELNELMATVAPKLEVRIVELPALNGGGSADAAVVTQLGVFAKEDIAPGEFVLDETSLLTANNRLQDALCDACSADLPDLTDHDAARNVVSCTDCEVVFCSQRCYDQAMLSYHPALCDRDVEAIAKDVPPAEAADALYALLLLRALAMAETQDCHPLELNEVKYIWADFHNALPIASHWHPAAADDLADHGLPRTLPFSFEQNVRLPLHMLEKMDVDIFCGQSQRRYDIWVFNTLYAKFRGTASARLSGATGSRRAGPARGPEVCAVHPMWCMANHSCDPNVSWEWGGSIRFWARDQRAPWQGLDGQSVVRRQPGIRKDEEVLNHYCDIGLSVQDRRDWARGALGGDCMCERCVWEAIHASK